MTGFASWARCNRAGGGGFSALALSPAVRLAALASLLAFCAACAPPSDAPPPVGRTGRIADVPDSLVARLGAGALTAAFARLDATPYEATVVVTEADDDGQTVGRFERRLAHAPGAAPRVLETQASGTLADTAGLDPARLRLSDPMPDLLADTPAYLAPATREQYAVRVAPAGEAFRSVDIRHTANTDQGVDRVSAIVDVATGAVRRMAVARANTSAIFDEATRADVRLAGGLPVAVETTSIVSTPLSGGHTYRVAWEIRPRGQGG